MPKKKEKPPTRVEFETFSPPDSYGVQRMQEHHADPDVFNGLVTFRKYRVTIELVEESPKVLQARLQKLWDVSNNTHHWGPLRDAAKSVGYELQGSPGSKRKGRRW